MRALVTGATGFIGRTLLQQIAEPVILSRNPQGAHKCARAEFHYWDPLSGLPPADAFAGVDCIFHLAGEPVGEGRWTTEKRRSLRRVALPAQKTLCRRLPGSVSDRACWSRRRPSATTARAVTKCSTSLPRLAVISWLTSAANGKLRLWTPSNTACASSALASASC